jgi:hypothetical protein
MAKPNSIVASAVRFHQGESSLLALAKASVILVSLGRRRRIDDLTGL